MEIRTLANEVSFAGVFRVYGSFPEKVGTTFSVREAAKQKLCRRWHEGVEDDV
uniref:hypothetical protein n=1 Tax=uncultured Erythrobacter sp. TaxID=263913 RepID=UPI002617862D|nr:hypothetical protein [uncultured Erythrobacter sp.]